MVKVLFVVGALIVQNRTNYDFGTIFMHNENLHLYTNRFLPQTLKTELFWTYSILCSNGGLLFNHSLMTHKSFQTTFLKSKQQITLGQRNKIMTSRKLERNLIQLTSTNPTINILKSSFKHDCSRAFVALPSY